jgi:hypothetical protein
MKSLLQLIYTNKKENIPLGGGQEESYDESQKQNTQVFNVPQHIQYKLPVKYQLRGRKCT